MAKHTVKQGECVDSIAFEKGFFWETIWNHAENAELKRKRKDPNVLLPGDDVLIPDKREKDDLAATEQRHRFKLKTTTELLRIRVLDPKGEPVMNEPYSLYIDTHPGGVQTEKQGENIFFDTQPHLSYTYLIEMQVLVSYK